MLADQLPAAGLVLDGQHVIVDVNRECERQLGFAGDDLRGRKLGEILPLAARVFFQTHVWPTIEIEGRVEELYVALRTKLGEHLPVVLDGHALEPAGSGFAIAFIPMRRRMYYERQLIEAREAAERSSHQEALALARADAMHAQLAVAERLAAVGELAAAVAHEINNPLAYVSANVELLLAASRGERSALEDVQQGVERIRDIVSSLKKLSRIDDARREPTDLGHVVDIALKIAGNQLNQRAEVRVEIEAPPPLVLGDEGRLAQVVINLLVNAAQALPDNARDRSVVRVSVKRDGESAEIAVADNGPGISPELQARIFDPFFTTKPVGEGTGLGLSVCHGVIKSLGGSIAVISDVGNGAAFVIRLPALAATAVVPPKRVRPATAEPAGANVRILAIDDDDGVARVLRRVFKDHQLDVRSSAQLAWDDFGVAGLAGFDVILCDLMMPGMTGVELFERVTRDQPVLASRFVFFTGGAFTPTSRAFVESGDHTILTKPFDVAQLKRVALEIAAQQRETK
jgi:two-component system, cell cycle sensor histidine kinase and response regulator CckA